MADFTQVKADLWQDPEFENLDPFSKLLWLNLLTTPTRNTAGLFHMSLARMSFETGIGRADIKATLETLVAQGWVLYNEASGVVWIKNFVKRQPFSHTIKDKVLKDVASIGRDHPLAQAFLTYYREILDTPPIPPAYPTHTPGMGSARGDGDGDGTGTGTGTSTGTEEEEGPPPATLLGFALRELPASESTPADYERTLTRHQARLPRSQIERIVCELAEWKPAKPRDKLHLTLNKWLAKEEPGGGGNGRPATYQPGGLVRTGRSENGEW